MPYRVVNLGDGTTGIARISDEALQEWIGVRERNRNIGYPDRPPDVDTPLFRTWILHPGDPNYQEYQDAQSDANAEMLVYSLATTLYGSIELKYLVNYFEGVYRHRVIVRNASGEDVALLRREESDFSNETFESTLERIANVFLPSSDEEPFISTYFDFIAIEEEVEAARLELKEFYRGNGIN